MPADVAHVRTTLQRLAALPPGSDDQPFVSLYLDLRVGANGTRPGLTFLCSALTRQERAFGPRGAALESFRADAERIQQLVERQLDPADQGLAVFACHARGVFEALPLAVAPENRLTVAPSPRLYQLARVLDDYTPYCVALLNRNTARVFTVALGDITRQAVLRQSDRHTTKTRAGGWSEGNYQRHVEHTVAEFAEEVAAAVAKVCAEQGIRRVVLGGETVALAALERALPAALGQNVVAVERMDAEAPDHQVLLATLPVAAAAEATEELATVDELLAMAAAGDLAVTGVEPVVYALQVGAADQLVMADGFAAEGWRCTSCLTYGAGGTPHACPACGKPVVNVDLKESLTGNAARLGVSVEFVRDGTPLDAVGGVGAFLRFPLA